MLGRGRNTVVGLNGKVYMLYKLLGKGKGVFLFGNRWRKEYSIRNLYSFVCVFFQYVYILFSSLMSSPFFSENLKYSSKDV